MELLTNGVSVPSGYGIEQRLLLYRFLSDGWPVAQIDFSGQGSSSVIQLNGLPIYPRMGDVWGADAMVMHSKHFQANAVFTMMDVWPLDQNLMRQVPHWIPYVPIDQDPVPENVLVSLRSAYKIITFSGFGQKELMKAGYTSTLILEGTDPDIYKPLDKIQCRKELGLPLDRFIIGMVGANKENPPRKGWQQALEAFKMFHDKHPEALFFWQSNQFFPSGFPILQYAHYLKLDGCLVSVDQYMGTFHFGPEMMAKWYNCLDFLTHASLTEGFGLCAVEAQSCGVPIIVNDCHSMPEIVDPGVTGEVCETGEKFYTNSLGFYHFPDVKSLYAKMESLFRADRAKMGLAARDRVLERYDINKIVKDKWTPFLEDLQKEILGPVIDKPVEKT